ncbi:SDR family oxidoreductase [Microvirga sp. M2]|uniref:SDR family oxidoreductase n=1 Tax=Microvirga sp. M2 TaxID=3073270 RepID=UPI0039C15AB3
MIYFVTGASGFIGKRLVRTLLVRSEATIFFLTRDTASRSLDELYRFWGTNCTRAVPVEGDLTRAGLGLKSEDLDQLTHGVDHIFHLAAVYDLEADPDIVMRTNVQGTREVVTLANRIGAKRFHHISSIAAAGLYEGVFREDMFDEAEHLEHPYFASKHDAERIVREECRIPWRVYRPGIVVGDSRTGEMDKIDGPYYFFKMIQKIRSLLPEWLPTPGLEGGYINLVPVDFVVAALDRIAHLDGQDGACFHLTDSKPHRVGDVLSIFARAAHAPPMGVRINAALFKMVPTELMKGLLALPAIRRIRRAFMKDLGLPTDILSILNYPTNFDNRQAARILEPAGITIPPIEDYAWRLWDYWERHLDPDLFVDRSLRGCVAGRTVLVTGGSSGIGKATAFRLAEAGAKTIIVAREADQLEETRQQGLERGLTFMTYVTDLTDPQQCDALIEKVKLTHGPVDILINNAGRSIRRGIEDSFERLHDFERMMAINYFGSLRLTLGLLPDMVKRGSGHIINISSIGVLANTPRFSAYVASKAAFEAWTRCAAAEFLDRGIAFTTINMPLVRTPMIAPTKVYDTVPALTPDEAAVFIVRAILRRPVRIATELGIISEILHALTPHVAQSITNAVYRTFPDTPAQNRNEAGAVSAEQTAMGHLLRDIHF